ncbi:MAG: NADPH-dependent glutamate synthase [Muribaculaceae bacterium]|nr:NADPH-dependent glutamate synthase [Muribaculaceae bacterium]
MNSRDSKWRTELRAAMLPKERTVIPRVKMPELDPSYRVTTLSHEVNQGLSREQAVLEATRCLDCPDPQCVSGCPVNINIPGFIKNIERRDFDQALVELRKTSALPAVCGRVCPQEKQCESKCIYNRMKKEPVAIGYLERFAADNASAPTAARPEPNGIKVAVAGSGPAGLSFAGAMASFGYEVTVFEALHEVGGVLIYGIPEFRLPNSIVEKEINALRDLGVRFETNTVIGKTLSYDQLLEMGFKALFVASGAGLPRFMNIPGENLVNIMSSNEYLTRINLMHAGTPGYATPVPRPKTVAIIGGGNTAMDSCRTARRMGAEKVMVVYRRSDAEMPARVEEVKHAREEGVEFLTLHNPIEYVGDDHGRVRAMRLQRMELGEPDSDGRRSPRPVEGAIVEIPVDLVIVSIGVSPNPIIPAAIDGLDVTTRGTIAVNGESLQSSLPNLYAGGDIVRGGATVILAMGDGRRAAKALHSQLNPQNS